MRLAGLGAAMVLAAAAWLAGALPSGDPAPTLRLEGLGSTSGKFQLGLVLWLVATAVLCVAWWHRKGSVWWFAPLLLAPPLASRDVYAYACQGDIWLAGLDPYKLGVADGGCLWTPSVPELWWHTPTPYGPLAIVLSGAAVGLAKIVSNDLDTQLAIAVTGLRLVALGGLALLGWGLQRLSKSRWLGLITPLVAIHAVSGAHNDALMAGLIVAALAAAKTRSKHDWIIAGVLLGGAVAVKVTALVALPFVLLLLPPWRQRWAALAAGVGTFAALTLASGLGLGWAQGLRNTGDLQQWTSLPTGAGMAAGYLLRAFGIDAMSACITVARALGLLAIAVIGLYAVRKSWKAPAATVIAACGWVLAAVAVLGPVFYPWYALAPLAVLAAGTEAWTKTRVAVTIGLCFLVLPNGLGLAVLTKGPGAFAAGAAVIALVAYAVRARPRSTA
ncbi:MAG: polyprenol phosphomannose-dependent alpha 1,6 mannosyltransferase MptB [Hamadaea sp.]|uniref:polyprenol phosphomannose-dependent alpha 1,6 mannosyltransferase MptB n=1 Tax=Hamadaea sp. TaxID=2024425 RepID=UPI001801E2FD|nr:polyprenol phosphomannose-dependent alpha 1,6 mannosyltransferase MptB [Hamadaea sp.]NUT24289.1 polyprenol phosphomannose-dependent alpha 1,6 mannosyltransferase MptB [Hamadaea sp.]